MAQRADVIAANLFDVFIQKGLKIASYAADATAEMAIQTTWPPILYLDPAGGAKTVLLPAEADSEGLVFLIVNTADASETITVEEDSSTTSIGTVAQNGFGLFHCDGTTWRKVLG